MLTLSEDQIVLEDVKLDQEKRFAVIINSDSPTSILHTRVSCGCTHPKLSTSHVEPESPAIMTVSFTPNSTGYHKKHVWIGWQEGGEIKEVKLDFSATVK